MRYVLDTNVVSALRVPGRNPAVAAWSSSIAASDQFVTALTIAEVERGVVAKERVDGPQGAVLRRWFTDLLLPAFAGRVLPFDLAAARVLATLRFPDHAPYDDALIAAVAKANAMTVATRNSRHFLPLDVDCIDPWQWPTV